MHFIGLVNVVDLKAGGLGNLGADQLEWLEADVKGRSASTPIVVFAHIPLWTVYPDWGWGTDDGAQALSYLKRFGSVTVLNGHIHQVMQKVEGNVTFHTARSTAFPQPAPGTAPSPGPMKVPDDKLRSMLGIANVTFKQNEQRARDHRLAAARLRESHVHFENTAKRAYRRRARRGRRAPVLAAVVLPARAQSAADGKRVSIDNFTFNPPNVDGEGRHHGDLDQQGRHPARHRLDRTTPSPNRRRWTPTTAIRLPSPRRGPTSTSATSIRT